MDGCSPASRRRRQRTAVRRAADDPIPPPGPVHADGASFVTLERAGALRGCVGTLEPIRPLHRDVLRNAFRAMRDPRLPPVTAADWPELDVRSPSWTAPAACPPPAGRRCWSRCVPHLHGLILTDGARRATFLPSVWAKLPAPEQFVDALLAQGRVERVAARGMRALAYGSTEFQDRSPRAAARDWMACVERAGRRGRQEGRRRLARRARRRPLLPGLVRVARRVAAGRERPRRAGRARARRGRAPPTSRLRGDHGGRIVTWTATVETLDPGRRGVGGARAAARREAPQRRHRHSRPGWASRVRGQPPHPGRGAPLVPLPEDSQAAPPQAVTGDQAAEAPVPPAQGPQRPPLRKQGLRHPRRRKSLAGASPQRKTPRR